MVVAHIIGVRAASLLGSATLLCAAVLAALSIRLAMVPFESAPDFHAVEMVRAEPAPQPAPAPKAPSPPRFRQPIASPMAALPAFEAQPPLSSELASNSAPSLAPPLVTDPRWTRRPSDLSRYYPERAIWRGIEGQVTLDCLVSATGLLSCAVESENPLGWGFGEAAQRIAREHRMAPALRDGHPIPARYRMRVPFELN